MWGKTCLADLLPYEVEIRSVEGERVLWILAVRWPQLLGIEHPAALDDTPD